MKRQGNYSLILERIFLSKYSQGAKEVDFERDDIVRFAAELKIKLPENRYDLPYSFRYRATLPESIKEKAGAGQNWIIRGVGPAKYRLALVPEFSLTANPNLAETKVPDATPGMVARYALTDEQALLARVRYNRLIDIFMGLVCYSLQNHLRTTVEKRQMETDELYVGIDKRGVQYVIPVQAKRGNDRLSIVQIEQDMDVCKSKFPALVCRPVGAQFMKDNVIALFEFEPSQDRVAVSSEKHYRLVPPEAVTEEDLAGYRTRRGD